MSEELKIINCRISATSLGMEDHGIMTFFIHLEWHGGGQGAGGFGIDGYDPETKERSIGYGPAIVAIRKILEVVGVSTWEQLKGQLVRAKVGGLGSSRAPIIGNILEDKWFDMKEFFAAQAKQKQ